MKTKFITFGIFFTLLFTSLHAQKNRKKDKFDEDRVWDVLKRIKNPDRTDNYIVDSGELRNWVEAVLTIYNSPRAKKKIDFNEDRKWDGIRAFDKNKDGEIDRQEERNLKDTMEKIFDNATEALKKEYDENRNKRLDRSEIENIKEEHPNFLEYAVRIAAGEHKEEHEEEEEEEEEKEGLGDDGEVEIVNKKPPVKKKVSIHSIYK